MPWKIVNEDNKYCLRKKNPDGSMGDMVEGSCHASRSETLSMQRAMYASEAKEITDETLSLLKEIANDGDDNKPERASAVLDEWKARVGEIPEEEKDSTEITPETVPSTDEKAVEQVEVSLDEAKAKRSDVSAADKKRAVGEYGDVTYADEANKKYPIDTAEHIRAAWNYINMPRNAAKYSDKGAAIKRKIVAAWKDKIDSKGPPSASKKDLLEKLKEVGEMVASWFKSEPENETGLSIWKEGNQYWWMARYSNKFRDNDNPPEIISSDSHKRFVELVKEGKAPLPELWLWHKKEWKVGQAHGIAYDESGFAVALGTFDVGKDNVAEALIKSKEPIKVSHGMPYSTIKRDEIDSTILVEHETREISPLPAWAAANKLTGFVVLNLESKEDTMGIPDETKKEWVNKLGINPETLTSLEDANAADADKAIKEGLESKEVPAETQPATEETPVIEPEVKSEPTVNEELLNAVKEAVTNILAPLNERIVALETNLIAVKEASEKRDEVLKGTPAASLSSILSGFAQSAIGATETQVDGRTSIAKGKPKEAAANGAGRIGIPFIDEMLANQ